MSNKHKGKGMRLPFDPDARPEIGKEYEDSIKRIFLVKEVNIPSHDGREVIGIIHKPGLHPPDDYSCTLQLWQELWHGKRKTVDPKGMTYP